MQEKIGQTIVLATSLCIILVFIWVLISLTSCQYLPQIAADVEQIADDTAIRAEVSREAIQRNTDARVDIIITNKETTK